MDDYAPLCETCGYDLEGLDHDAKCPECARPVASSDPGARPGSPWQRQPGFFSLAATAWALLRRPGKLFEHISIRPGSAWLAALSMLGAGVLVADPWIGVWIRDPARNARPWQSLADFARYAGSFAAGAVGVALVLLMLTLIEYRGIRFFSARRGWRLTRVAAWQICAHASVAWTLCGILPLIVLAIKEALVRVLHYSPHAVIDLGPVFGTFNVSDLLSGGGVALGYFLGMMAFEMLVYIGVRKCRFAARLRETPPPAFAPAPATT